MNVQQAIDKMNLLASKSQKFLFIIDFEMQEPIVMHESEIDSQEILFKLENINSEESISENKTENKINLKKEFDFITNKIYPTETAYNQAFQLCQNNIQQGNSYLINLTQPTEIELSISLKEIFFLTEAKYKLWIKDKLVLFSPESFVKIQNGIISSYPMKGTIDAALHDAEEIILNDLKEKSEHATIVDLIRNDLSIVAHNVIVEKYRYIEQVQTPHKTLLQVSSKISGELPNNYKDRFGEIIFSLLPAGSISGAPKKKTTEIILEAENYSRGYYTGVFGFFDGENLDSGVMIRYIEKIGEKYFYKSGGGITYLSHLQTEYQELKDKIYLPITPQHE